MLVISCHLFSLHIKCHFISPLFFLYKVQLFTSCMGWGWYTCSMYDGCPYTRECQPLMWWEEVSFGGALVTFHVGLPLHKRGCPSWSDAPPPRSLLPTYPWSSSFPYKHLPSLVWGHQVSSSLCLSFCYSTIFVGMLLAIDWACASHRVVLNLSCIETTYSSTCLMEASLMGASLLPMVGKTKLTRSLGHHLNIK